MSNERKTTLKQSELIQKAIEYNNELHRCSVPEVERCTFISAILVALQNKDFYFTYCKEKMVKRT